MSTPQTIEITSCALGGHLLGRGDAVKKQLEEEYPEAKIENKKGHLLQFTVEKDGKPVMGKTFSEGATTMVGLLMCCKSPRSVASQVKETS